MLQRVQTDLDEVFVESNMNPVAPVKLCKAGIIAEGSTITESVPPDAVVFRRAPQVSKEGRAEVLRRKQQTRAEGREMRAESQELRGKWVTIVAFLG